MENYPNGLNADAVTSHKNKLLNKVPDIITSVNDNSEQTEKNKQSPKIVETNICKNNEQKKTEENGWLTQTINNFGFVFILAILGGIGYFLFDFIKSEWPYVYAVLLFIVILWRWVCKD